MSFESGFIKRALEYGLDKYQAIALLKSADRKEKAEEYIPQNFIGAVGDYLTPGGFGGYRAGKSVALQKALGKKPGWASTNPLASTILSSLAGGLVGGAAGHQYEQRFDDGNGAGTGVGALAGTALGGLLPGFIRRSDTKDSLKEFADGAKINPKKPDKLRGIGNLTLPLSGHHRKGEAVGYNKLRGIDEDETMNTALNTSQLIPGPVGALSQLLGGHLQNYSADKTMDKKK